MNKPHLLLSLLCVLTACGGPAYVSRPAPTLDRAITERGELVYRGRVYPLTPTAASPTYVYERRVAREADQLISTHVTRDNSGAIQLAEAAVHSPDYTLREYTLYANQLGQTGSVRVDAGEVSFVVRDADGERRNSEHVSEPVVVGPTLIGFMVTNLAALEAGATRSVRMAVVDRMESIGFELEAVPAAAGRTRVKMSASGLLYSLAIDPIYFTFDKDSRKLALIEGRVPTKVREGDRWADFDARVEYDFVRKQYL